MRGVRRWQQVTPNPCAAGPERQALPQELLAVYAAGCLRRCRHYPTEPGAVLHVRALRIPRKLARITAWLPGLGQQCKCSDRRHAGPAAWGMPFILLQLRGRKQGVPKTCLHHVRAWRIPAACWADLLRLQHSCWSMTWCCHCSPPTAGMRLCSRCCAARWSSLRGC